MQRVQAVIRRCPPFTFARTLCRLGSNRRDVTLWAWLRVRPTTGVLPQISQRLSMMRFLPLTTCRLFRTARKLPSITNDSSFRLAETETRARASKGARERGLELPNASGETMTHQLPTLPEQPGFLWRS